jgi:hypothetical protein
LVRKERTYPASENAPAASPASLEPLGHATRTLALSYPTRSRRPLRVDDRVDATCVPSRAAA